MSRTIKQDILFEITFGEDGNNITNRILSIFEERFLQWQDDDGGDLKAEFEGRTYHISEIESVSLKTFKFGKYWEAWTDSTDIKKFATLAESINYCHQLAIKYTK